VTRDSAENALLGFASESLKSASEGGSFRGIFPLRRSGAPFLSRGILLDVRDLLVRLGEATLRPSDDLLFGGGSLLISAIALPHG
jgi:hypothetical protein